MPTYRNRRDADLIVTRTIAAANASNASTAIDLGAVTPGVTLEGVTLEIVQPALPALVATDKFLTITVEDSADNSTFAVIAGTPSISTAGVATTGAAAKTTIVKLPPATRRYVRITTAITASGGDSTGVTITASLLT